MLLGLQKLPMQLLRHKGWKTIETFEKLNQSCEHGVKLGDWCERCNRDMKQAERDNAGTPQPLTCANCEEVSTNPGQFVRGGQWVCCETCRTELLTKGSYDDLAASGGIVDAP